MLIAGLISVFTIVILALGGRGYAVESNSMSPRLERGDVVFVRSVSFDKLEKGDIITAHFPVSEGVFTHRVIEVDRENKLVRTRGDNNLSDDPMPTVESNIIGKIWFSIPYIGFISLKLNMTILVSVLLAVAVIVIITRFILESVKRKDS